MSRGVFFSLGSCFKEKEEGQQKGVKVTKKDTCRQNGKSWKCYVNDSFFTMP